MKKILSPDKRLVLLLLILVILFSAGLALNYFGIIRLSALHPAFSILPVKEPPVSRRVLPPRLEQPPETEKVSIFCPAGAEFCAAPRPILKNNRFVGIGAGLEPDTPIYAVFDGTLVVRGVSIGDEEDFLQAVLASKDGKYKAFYFVKEGQITNREYKRGEKLASAAAPAMAYYQGSNFVFLLTDAGGQEITLDRIKFESGE